jgi:serine/threonine protein kinase/Tol biopolymer transport system component
MRVRRRDSEATIDLDPTRNKRKAGPPVTDRAKVLRTLESANRTYNARGPQQSSMNPGTQLGPYRVESLIGAGGMGEVYLGVDTRLDRQVAIKILASDLARDSAHRERFEREARTISSLSHPNICTLFDLGTHASGDYLVMEYLQGETLADRIARGPLPYAEVVRIGAAIAAALEAAHRQGIVHRDLKPGNVMLTKSGVKLLDFGLAKLSLSSPSSGGIALGNDATQQKPLTEQGAILGTFQYMAPEQLEGAPADARTDIFAAGAILYEMATGRRAFQGATKASLIASIIQLDPPPMSEVQPLTPRALERVVRACLEKDPADRFQTAHDLGLELKWTAESSSISEPVNVRRARKTLPWAAAAVFAVAAIASGALLWREKSKPSQPYRLAIVPERGYTIIAATISPDASMLALIQRDKRSGDGSLWVRRIDDGSERLLAKGDLVAPFWSPDSRWIGYRFLPDQVMRVSPEGGQPELMLRTTVQSTPAWGSDGTLLFCPTWGKGLFRVSVNGGEPVAVTKLDLSRRESVHTLPTFLPGHRRFLYTVHTIAEKRNEIWGGSLDATTTTRVVVADALVGYNRPWLLFVRDGAAYAQRFDDKSMLVSGEATRVVDNVTFQETEATAAATLSDNGALVYGAFEGIRMRLQEYDRNGGIVATLWEDDNLSDAILSRDGSTLLVVKFDQTKGAADIHSVDLARKVSTRVTTGLAGHAAPIPSADGQSVAFYSDRTGLFDIFIQSLDGATPARAVWQGGRDKFLYDWSPDGTTLLVGSFTPETRMDLWAVPATGGTPRPFVATENNETDAQFSPDGKWVSYVVSSGKDYELYVRPYPTGRAVRVSTDGGGRASWRPDGRELLWPSRGRIFTAAIDTSGATPQIAAPKELFRMPFVMSQPRYLADGHIAFLSPAPGEELTANYQFDTAWRTKLDRGN